jgi:hypothetical protein
MRSVALIVGEDALPHVKPNRRASATSCVGAAFGDVTRLVKSYRKTKPESPRFGLLMR